MRKLRLEIETLAKSKAPRRNRAPESYDPSTDLAYEDRCGVLVSNIVGHATAKPGILDRLTLDKESPATQRAIQEKAMRVAPAYNKGGYTYEGAALADTLKTNKRRE